MTVNNLLGGILVISLSKGGDVWLGPKDGEFAAAHVADEELSDPALRRAVDNGYAMLGEGSLSLQDRKAQTKMLQTAMREMVAYARRGS